MPPIAQRTVQAAASYPAPSSVAAPKDIPLVLQTTSKECVSSAAAPVETRAEERAASAALDMAGSAVHAATLETSKTAPSKKQVVVAPITLPSSAAAIAAAADVDEEGGGKSRAESFDADLERKFPGLCSGSWLPEIDAKIAYMKAKFKEMQVSVAKQLQKLGKEMQALEGTVICFRPNVLSMVTSSSSSSSPHPSFLTGNKHHHRHFFPFPLPSLLAKIMRQTPTPLPGSKASLAETQKETWDDPGVVAEKLSAVIAAVKEVGDETTAPRSSITTTTAPRSNINASRGGNTDGGFLRGVGGEASHPPSYRNSWQFFYADARSTC